MDTHTQKFKVRLGLFIAGGLALFVIAIFIIGKQKHLFDPVFKLSSTFYNVSGLQVGNNIRFSGITVGTVDGIKIINDSTVQVDMLIKKDVMRFIKTDCGVAIGSSGLIGDKLLFITQGSTDAPVVKDGQQLASSEPVELDAIMANLQVTSEQLAEIMYNINNGNGTLGRLIKDSTIANDFSQTMMNIKSSSKGFSENMDAAKHNFLLKGYFNKKAKAAEEKKKEDEKVKAAEKKKNDKEDKKAAKQKIKDEKK
ncbi:MAG: MlaD family protein [Bacteroidales bacterium]|jgi:phospholipid/cholesterol/gamma-HCH transport system substrate-binding protein|nr:MlaD family protein [Bacteroidales bacterium]